MRTTDYRETIRVILSDDGNDDPEASRLRLKLMYALMDSDLTKTQKCYIMAYYRDGMKITDIAAKYGVSPSTVSRTIGRGRKRLFKAMTGREIYRRYTG